MSEDEKISIEWLEKITEINKKDGVENSCAEILLKLIKKLQKENEELEEINNELEAEKNEAIRRYNFESIPVSLVEEKIEELNKKEQKLQNSISAEEREEYSDANISWDLMDINIKREVLQELIEESE